MPVLPSTCRLQRIIAQQAARVRANHEQCAELLKSRERPFSFYATDLDKVMARKNRPPPDDSKKHLKPFRANPVPRSVRGVSHALRDVGGLDAGHRTLVLVLAFMWHGDRT